MTAVLKFISENWAMLAIVVSIIAILAIIIYVCYKIRDKLMERVVYKRVFTDVGAYEGETVTLIETCYNPTPFPLFFVNIEGYMYNGIPFEKYSVDQSKAMQYYVSRFHLMPFQQIRRKHSVKCAKRGYYKLETVDIYYNKKQRFISCPADVYVYPKIIPMADYSQPTSDKQGDSFTRRWLIQDPFSLSGIREYRSGDSFNMINFKATARSGSVNLDAFKVNNREYCSARIFMVYLNFQTDTEVPMSTRSYEAMMELGLSFASAIIRDAAYNGYRVGFAANCCTVSGEDSIHFPIEAGQTHLEEILKEMAKVRHRVGISFASLLQRDILDSISDNEIYILTPFVNEELDEQIAQFRRFGNNCTVYRLEDEEKARHDEEERELAKAQAERRKIEEEMFKSSKERQALLRILEQQKEMEEKEKREAEEREAESRRRDKETREAAAQDRKDSLRERQASRDGIDRVIIKGDDEKSSNKGGGN